MKDKLVKISKPGISKLYQHDLYTTKNYDFTIAKRIREYDIKAANLNLCKYYDLLPDKELTKIEDMSKVERNVYVGCLMRDRKFNKELTDAFRSIRKEFFIANGIIDSDVLSIKKDAIYVIGKKCRVTEFKNIVFVEKNTYTSYHNLNNMEFYYYGKNNQLDIKGINESSLYQYEKFTNILKRIFRLLEMNNREEFVKFMKRFSEDYKNKRLTYDYYREFKPNGLFTLQLNNNDNKIIYGIESTDSTVNDILSINYNYIAYIIPLLQRHYFKFSKK